MKDNNTPLMVTIRCITYNQEIYIRQCLEGFVMQKTNFRYEAIVHDDASTDGTAAIIREYEEKYPDIIKPIYETENQYSKHDGSLRRIMEENTHGKYVALCEGDDYWTDPLKLQKQFDYMELHPECSLCFHAAYILHPDGTQTIKRPSVIKQTYNAEDAILGGGGFMVTNSMFYRSKYIKIEGIPDFWVKAPIGDLPCMLFLASKGELGYLDNIMSVYRHQAKGSWTERMKNRNVRNNHRKGCLIMYKAFDSYTKMKYHSTIKIRLSINRKNHMKADIARLLWPLYAFWQKIKFLLKS